MAQSLVLQLQSAAHSGSTSIGEVVRTARVVASKLALNDFNSWLEHELHGYGPGDDVPAYRKIAGQLQTLNPYIGQYIPVRFSAGVIEKLCNLEFREPVGEIEDMLSSESLGFLMVTLGSHNSEVIRKALGPEDRQWADPFVRVEKCQAFRILDRVRSIVLDWSLKLESEGVLGSDMTFSSEEQSRAHRATTINIGNFTGTIGNVTAHNVAIGQLDQLSQELTNSGVSPEEVTEIRQLLSSLREASPERKAGLAKRALEWAADRAEQLGPALALLSAMIAAAST